MADSRLIFNKFIFAAFRGEGDAEAVRSREAAEWIFNHREDLLRCFDHEEFRLMKIVIRHFRAHKEAPSRARFNADLDEMPNATSCETVMKTYDKLAHGLGNVHDVIDLDSLLAEKNDAHNVDAISTILSRANDIALGRASRSDFDPKKYPEGMQGWEDAKKFYVEHMASGIIIDTRPKPVEGSLKDNAALIGDTLIKGLQDRAASRCFTGLKHIDKKCAIGPKDSLKYIGILGFSNHGKSMLLRQIAYNQMLAGKRILYISREDNVGNTWAQLAFLHAYSMPKLDIPDYDTWDLNPLAISEAHKTNLKTLMTDIEKGKTLPGDISVYSHGTWPKIMEELDRGYDRQPYDVLMIDYLAHLDPESKRVGDQNTDILGLFKKAQGLCQDYWNQRGLVIFTALQANKDGQIKAAALEGEDWGTYSEISAIEMFTSAGRDMDMIIGTWSSDLLRKHKMLKICCAKSRNARFESKRPSNITF
jgi:archaellum biogenesis ATPase FlaH